MMKAGAQEPLVLANIEKDSCLDKAVTTAFFERLAACGPPSTPDEAWLFACKIVRDAPDRFVCQGREVPETMFVGLFRFQSVSALRYALPRGFLESIGYRDKEFCDDTEEEDLRSAADEYDGPINLGNKLQIVWVTDFAEIENKLNDPTALTNWLGIDAHRYILCVYNREDTGRTLHVPRALDGVDRPLFQVVDDPAADCGWTKPADGSEEGGRPEAVHRKCSVVPQRWELVTS